MKVTIKETGDIAALMRWRAEVIEMVFGITPSASLLDANRRYYEENIRRGRHIAVIAECGSAEAGCGSICLSEELPSPDNLSGRCAYLMNIYVRKEYRGKGIGHSIVRWLVDYARTAGCGKIYLETTRAARSLYISIGFEDMPDMMKYADIQNS